MKDLDLFVFVAVFQEMLGAFLWIGLGAVALVALLFVWLLLRERGMAAGRLVRSELVGLVGGVLAILVMQAVTHSGFSDIGGPIDWVLVALIWLAGFVIATLAAYVGFGLLALRRSAPVTGRPLQKPA
ncbi:DUF5368 domain-containing protein [Falsiroseomonas sp.]|uniref:DUF5368 domain-containing protein n=1 Tax=Falsiroseomonas sp. TaxID=2870721 RepID=UPI0035615D77